MWMLVPQTCPSVFFHCLAVQWQMDRPYISRLLIQSQWFQAKSPGTLKTHSPMDPNQTHGPPMVTPSGLFGRHIGLTLGGSGDTFVIVSKIDVTYTRTDSCTLMNTADNPDSTTVDQLHLITIDDELDAKNEFHVSAAHYTCAETCIPGMWHRSNWQTTPADVGGTDISQYICNAHTLWGLMGVCISSSESWM